MSLRALDVLGAVECVAAEDTRVTQKLLRHHAIDARLIAAHEHNEQRAAQRIVGLLRGGGSVALVTDAGTPGVSDPGARIVAAVRAAGFEVVPIPGANAAIAALSATGSTATRFLFCGFLPARPAARRKEIEQLRALPYLLVLYEAPHRVLETLADLRTILGAEREVTIAREITKQFESFHTCRLGEAEQWVAADAYREKGEFVLLVAGSEETENPEQSQAGHTLSVLLEALPLKQAVDLAAAISGTSRKRLYERALEMRDQHGE